MNTKQNPTNMYANAQTWNPSDDVGATSVQLPGNDTIRRPEKWRPVPGFPDYDVSDRGVVRSWKRGGPRLLTPFRAGAGLQVQLFSEAASPTLRVEHVVAAAFIGPKPPGAVLKHRNGDLRDNCVVNLAFMAPNEASHHGHVLGRYRTKLDVRDVQEMRQFAEAGIPAGEIGETYGVSRNYVYKVLGRHRWSWVREGAEDQRPRPARPRSAQDGGLANDDRATD